MDDRLLTIRQTAQRFNLTTGLLYTAIARGELAAIRFRPRGRIRLREHDVSDWIEGHAVSASVHQAGRSRANSQSTVPSALEHILPPSAPRRFA